LEDLYKISITHLDITVEVHGVSSTSIHFDREICVGYVNIHNEQSCIHYLYVSEIFHEVRVGIPLFVLSPLKMKH
jgi:hypothetical protein